MRTFLAVLCLLAAIPGLVPAQKLSPEALANYEKQLPDALKSAPNPFAQTYLKGLQAQLASAKDAAARKAVSLDVANAMRTIEELGKQKDSPLAAAPLAYYVVPALSDVMRLPGTFPSDGKLGGELRLVAAKDEYEAASFVVLPFDTLAKVELKVSALGGPNGAVVPATNLELKVVKVWYQNGNGWFSYFSDVGLEPVPELLLNDETLINVDTAGKANYARIDYPAGSQYRWISPPRLIDSRYGEHGWLSFQTFRPLIEPFADAASLQPVGLTAGQFKQFWLTAHAPANAAEGIYRGSLTLTADGKKIAGIPVALRVLPFELPEPRTCFDPEREFLVSMMGTPTIHGLMRDNGGDRALAETQLLAMLKNMRRHNLMHPMLSNYQPGEMLKRHIDLMKEAGLKTRPLIGNTMQFLGHGGAPLGFDALMIARQQAEMWQKFYQDTVGHTDAYLASGDEPPASWVAKMRPAWKYFHERGLKIVTAGHTGMFITGGYIYDMHPAAGYPEEEEKTKTWNTVGHAYVSFYAGQHNGSENPSFVRRQHGLLGYLSGFSMVCNYEFALGPWNDLAYDLYKPMVVAYADRNGLVDTLAWEGFREGIDDIRYATLLKQKAKEAIDSGKLERVYAGRKALQWFALLDGISVDLNAARSEMINTIMQLSNLR